MPRFRRSQSETRIEMVPLIDVIFLVLTFFIYALILMIPAKILPMRMQALAGGVQGERLPAVSISIDRQGRIAVDREFVDLDDVLARVRMAVEQEPGTVVYIAAEENADVNQMPVFLELYQRLFNAGLDIRLVGRREE